MLGLAQCPINLRMFLSVSELFFSKIIREEKIESTPFSFADETYGDIKTREQVF
jgi:hypothetical protein